MYLFQPEIHTFVYIYVHIPYINLYICTPFPCLELHVTKLFPSTLHIYIYAYTYILCRCVCVCMCMFGCWTPTRKQRNTRDFEAIAPVDAAANRSFHILELASMNIPTALHFRDFSYYIKFSS